MAINRISLYHLETLLWIDRLGTFAAAADRLNTTQPAISARVRELESHLSVRLFRREGRTMSLTPAGRQLVRDYGPIWGDLQTVLTRCGGFGEVSGVVRIGTGEIVAASCLPAFLADLKKTMPFVSLELEIDLTANLIQQLLRGQTDIAFAAGPISHPALTACSIGAVGLKWLASPKVRDAFSQGRGDHMIPVWSLATHSPIHGRMKDAISASRISLGMLNQCNNVQMMIDIAKAGGGIGIFPEPMVYAHQADASLVQLEGMPMLSPIEFHVVKRASDNELITQAIFDQAAQLQMRATDAD